MNCEKIFTEYLPLALLAGFLSLLVATIFPGMLTAPLANNIIAANTKKELVNTPLPAKTQLCDSISKAGKLMGNGNGIQFFGAILLKSDLTQDELESYYAPYRAQERTFLIES